MNFPAWLTHKKILLVDDDEWIRDSMGLFFETEGYGFRAVETGEAGIDELKVRDYDIIITDYRLPGMDGLEFLKRIQFHHPEAVKLLITAYGDDRLEAEAVRVGVGCYIRKPFDMQDIEKALIRLTGNGGTAA